MTATFVACFIITCAIPQDPYIRYQSFRGTIFERLTWVYERIHFDEKPIDVVIIGSSRAGRGIDSRLVEKDLLAKGLSYSVANLSLPASGLDIRYTEAEELFRTRDVKLLILPVVEALPRDGHQAFGDLATPSQILTSPPIVNRNLPLNLIQLPMRQIKLGVATLVPEAFGYRASFDPETYQGSYRPAGKPNEEGGSGQGALTDAEHKEALEKESRRRHRQIRPPILPDSLGWVEFGVSRSYVKKILELAETNGTKVAFVFLPFYKGYNEPRDLAWLEQFGPVFTADFMMDDARNYSDAAHASDRILPQIAQWIADRIAMTLAPENDPKSVSADEKTQ
ncbi:hypothetical protein [Roseibium aggregatum]|uniref:Uncharacterized protein n=1 Tax=Roseibium aggregatum TaxID=187304 RepID=A0A939EBU6_9HYPH|nr:hypothetical protein [Roseibium aggregatum]MBN9669876.1 hypothetical protein [Roseibium aggregatum]